VPYAPDPLLPAVVSIGQVALAEGRVRLRGWALAPEPITRVALSVGETPLGQAETGEVRNDVAKNHPEYMNRHGGFTFEGEAPEALDEEALLRVRAFAGERLLAEQTRPWPKGGTR